MEFDFNIGSILKITEENVGIIQFNSLDIIQCNEENNAGEYLYQYIVDAIPIE